MRFSYRCIYRIFLSLQDSRPACPYRLRPVLPHVLLASNHRSSQIGTICTVRICPNWRWVLRGRFCLPCYLWERWARRWIRNSNKWRHWLDVGNIRLRDPALLLRRSLIIIKQLFYFSRPASTLWYHTLHWNSLNGMEIHRFLCYYLRYNI